MIWAIILLVFGMAIFSHVFTTAFDDEIIRQLKLQLIEMETITK
ncbi:hypothetical protein [Salmonella enterica]